MGGQRIHILHGLIDVGGVDTGQLPRLVAAIQVTGNLVDIAADLAEFSQQV